MNCELPKPQGAMAQLLDGVVSGRQNGADVGPGYGALLLKAAVTGAVQAGAEPL